MSVKEKMTAIADAIREKTGDMDLLTLDGMAEAIGRVYIAGETSSRAECAAQHYATTVYASAENLQVKLPFTPDVIYIMSFDPRIFGGTAATIGYLYDLWGFGQYVGTRVRTNAMAILNNVTVHNFLSVNGNTYTFTTNEAQPWQPDYAYTVLACRFPDRDDADRIRAFIDTLDSSGSVTLQQEKVNAAFTADEWEALIVTKPNITFNLI